MIRAPAADEEDRRKARLELGANVVVEAGAGTGKTTLLTDRILFLLLGSDREPPPSVSSVVALTFTEKAAGEIKLRLTDRLSDLVALLSVAELPEWKRAWADGVLEDLRVRFRKDKATVLERARAALEEMDKASIGTIHAFASQILRLYPVQAGVDPNFVVDEGELFDELFDSEWARWLDEELGEDSPRRGPWLEVLRHAGLDDLEGLARELCGEKVDLDSVGRADPAVADWLEETAARLSRAREGQPPPRANSRILEAVDAVCLRLRALAAAARSPEPPLQQSPVQEEIPESKWPQGWDEAGKPLYEEAREAARASSAVDEALLRRAVRLLLAFAHSFRCLYTRRGIVSFDGLLRKARDLVREHPEVREELKRRHPTLLIDEFQDTDPLQGELLLYLAEEPGRCSRSWADAKPGAGRLFVVGDPKQSIYRFRGADIAAYQRFTEVLLKDTSALSCDLKTNFRSPASILGPVNAVFSGVMRYEPGLQPPYKAIVPKDASTAGAAAVEFVRVAAPKKEGAPFGAEVVQRREAEWIARWILENCGEGKARRYKDVAVLLRSSTPVRTLLDVLKRRRIPYAVEIEGYFYGAQEVLDFLNLLRVLEDPADRLSMAGLLRSPLVALEDRELLALAGSGLDYLKAPQASLPAGAQSRVERFYAALRRLRSRVGRVALGDLVRAILEETSLVELAARAYHGQQTVSNLEKFARMAAEESDSRGMTLREFIERVSREMGDMRSEGESPLADEHLDAVRIMTIHKAKGLEFPVVFVSNASSGRGRGREPVSRLDWATGRVGLRLPSGAADASRAWLDAREELRQDRETTRLLYVAATRAKEKLFILGKEKADAGSLAARLSEAGAWPAPGSRPEPGEEPEEISLGGRIAMRRLHADEDVLSGLGALPKGRKSVLPPARSLASFWERRLKRRDETAAMPRTLAPTDYLKEPDKRFFPSEDVAAGTAGAWVEAGGRRSRGRLEIAFGRGALVGQACHKVLESWDFKKRGNVEEAVASACGLLERLRPGADWKSVAREAHGILDAFLESPAAKEFARVEIVGREIPFIYPEDGAVMRGSIDLLYRLGGKLVVADYKTDKLTKKDLAARRKKYERQGAAYRAAVEKAVGAKGVEFRLIFLRHPEFES